MHSTAAAASRIDNLFSASFTEQNQRATNQIASTFNAKPFRLHILQHRNDKFIEFMKIILCVVFFSWFRIRCPQTDRAERLCYYFIVEWILCRNKNISYARRPATCHKLNNNDDGNEIPFCCRAAPRETLNTCLFIKSMLLLLPLLLHSTFNWNIRISFYSWKATIATANTRFVCNEKQLPVTGSVAPFSQRQTKHNALQLLGRVHLRIRFTSKIFCAVTRFEVKPCDANGRSIECVESNPVNNFRSSAAPSLAHSYKCI